MPSAQPRIDAPPVALPADPLAAPLLDAQGRKLTYLRLSLTDRCNFRCTYCSPATWGGNSRLLTEDEVVRLVSIFAQMGIRKVRLTGGEPLVRKDIVGIARRVSALAGVEAVALTTNGHLLPELARPLIEAGVSRLNISLDTLDPERFAKVTGGAGDLARLLAGIDACVAAGFRGIKLNTVVMGGVNDAEVPAIIRYAWSKGLVPRFIECMPFADGRPVPTLELVERVRAAGLELAPAIEPSGADALPAGPSEYWRGEGGRVGFIGPLTRNFCAQCNRVRISAEGGLHPCLGGVVAVPLAPLLRGNAADREVAVAIREALLRKPDGHSMTSPDAKARLASMMGVGG